MSKVIRNLGNGRYAFYCPGCKEEHTYTTDVSKDNIAWSFNGNMEKPKFTPSLLIRSGHYVPGHESDSCWCTYNKEQIAKGEETVPFACGVCHLFVTDGVINYCGDCTHDHNGLQNVPMIPIT